MSQINEAVSMMKYFNFKQPQTKEPVLRQLLQENEIGSVDAVFRRAPILISNSKNSGLDDDELLEVNKGIKALRKLFYESK